jgi:hypothetical protein
MSLEVRDYHVLKSRITVDQVKAYFLQPRDAVDPLFTLKFWTDYESGRREVEQYVCTALHNFSCSLVSPLLAK